MKKICVLGVIAGIVLVVLGFAMIGISNEVNFYATHSSFGGDFYTYQYDATVRIGETIEVIGTYAFLLGGIGMIAFGVAVMCYFGCKYETAKIEASNEKASGSYASHLSGMAADTEGNVNNGQTANADVWICKNCNARNANYISTCKCGQNKLDN